MKKKKSPNKSVTSIKVDRLNTPKKSFRLNKSYKKLSASKDWKQHGRETHKINANKKKAGLAISISSKVTFRVKKKKKSQCNQKGEHH